MIELNCLKSNQMAATNRDIWGQKDLATSEQEKKQLVRKNALRDCSMWNLIG